MASISNPEPNILRLEGEIDLQESPAVKQHLSRMLETKPERILIDFTGVKYIDSSGLAVLIEAMQRVNRYGGRLALFGIHANVRNIFQISRLDQVFAIYPDREAAEQEG